MSLFCLLRRARLAADEAGAFTQLLAQTRTTRSPLHRAVSCSHRLGRTNCPCDSASQQVASVCEYACCPERPQPSPRCGRQGSPRQWIKQPGLFVWGSYGAAQPTTRAKASGCLVRNRWTHAPIEGIEAQRARGTRVSHSLPGSPRLPRSAGQMLADAGWLGCLRCWGH